MARGETLLQRAKHNAWLGATLLLWLAAIGALSFRFGLLPAIVPPADDAFVGLSVKEITNRLGKPNDQRQGHYGNPHYQWDATYEPCESLTYRKWNGTLYISVYPKHGEWVCFCSNWVSAGHSF